MAILYVCLAGAVFFSVHVSLDKIMEGVPTTLTINSMTNDAYAAPCTKDLPTPQPVIASDLDKTYDVIIIGAGVSGLEAAHQLHLKGIDNVVILEKNDRIGGRVWSVDYNGTCIEKGASWIHGLNNYTDKIHNPLYDITEKNSPKILIQKTDYTSSQLRDSNGKIHDDTSDEIYGNFEKLYTVKSMGQKQLNKTTVGNAISLKDLVVPYYQKYYGNEEQINGKMFNYSIFSYQEFDQVADLDNISINSLIANQYFKKDSEANEAIFFNGYDQIVNVLSEGLNKNIKRATVTNVTYSEYPALVKTDQGTFKGKYVISTLPLGVMKNDAVKFNPTFDKSDSDKAQAIHDLKNGTMDKYFLIFNETNLFWKYDDDKDWIVRIPDNGSDKGWLAFFNLHKYTKKPILLAFNTGNYAIKLENENDSAIKKEVTTVLRNMYKNQTIPEPKIIATKHAKDTSFYGSYSFVSAGGSEDSYQNLARPLNQRLFFAGEATMYDYIGTVHGAYLSGYLASQEILAIEHKKVDSPRDQFKKGVEPPDIICKENYLLALKPAGTTNSTYDRVTNKGIIVTSQPTPVVGATDHRYACIDETNENGIKRIISSWGLEKTPPGVTFPW